MSSSIQQLNIGYHPTEDRLQLRILLNSNEEVRLWLTRRICTELLKTLNTSTDQSGNIPNSPYADGIRDFQRETMLATTDFSESYRAQQVVSTPLGEQPLLVTRLLHQQLPQGNLKLTLLCEPQEINLNLDPVTLHGLAKMVLESATTADWSINLSQTDLPPQQPALH